MSLYPLSFHPVYLPKIWGSRALERLGRMLPAGDQIGESWELADLAGTHPDGAGGQAVRSVVARGPLAGWTLNQILRERGLDLLGRLRPGPEGGFPLLVKLLSSGRSLSVQVHPSPEYARRHPGVHLKHEAWYVLHAEPGAVIYKGLRPGVGIKDVQTALADGRMEALLNQIPARVGDCHHLPSGIVHALGGGIIVAEIQTPGDTTFRLYDWGRTGRPLHTAEALACLQSDSAVSAENFEPGTRIENSGSVLETLVNCGDFRIEKISCRRAMAVELPPANEPKVWMILEGTGRFSCPLLPAEESGFEPFQTFLLPAVTESCQAHFDGPAMLLQVTFPAAGADLLA